MIEELLLELEEKMEKTLAKTKERFSHIRAGRANVSMIDGISVDYFGQMTPLNQVGGLSAPESRLIVIDPWDKSLIPAIEKEIMKANLGFTPSNDGRVIRLVIPELTEERRKEYVKVVKKEAEEGKIAVRSIRQDANTKLKKLEKDGDITEDELKNGQDQVQKYTDKYVAQIDEALGRKEKELMSI